MRFTAGTLQHNVNFLKTIINNCYVLTIVSGYAFELNDAFTEVMSSTQPLMSKFDKFTSDRISAQVDELFSIHVVEECSQCEGEYISPIFLVEKINSVYRKILNLKRCNVCVEYCHFEMEHLKTVCDLISRGSFMSSIDLRKVCYSVSISVNSRKYLNE